MTALDQPAGVRWLDPGTAARVAIDPAEAAAWRHRVELEARVAAAAAALVESRMPAAAPPARPGGPLRVGGPIAAALAVALVYVGLPLALAASAVLGALPNALVLAAAVLVLATVAVLAVLRRTSAALVPRRRGAGVVLGPRAARSQRRSRHPAGAVPVPRVHRPRGGPARTGGPAPHRPAAPGGPRPHGPAGRHRARPEHVRR